MYDESQTEACLTAWRKPALQTGFSDWVGAAVQGQQTAFRPPSAPVIPRFLDDHQLWHRDAFWRSAADRKQLDPEFAELEAGWNAVLIPAIIQNPVVLNTLLHRGLEWLHHFSMWNIPPHGADNTADSDETSDWVTDDGFESVTPLPLMAAFYSFTQVCNRNALEGEEKQRWAAWGRLAHRALDPTGIYWQAGTGWDLALMHAFARRTGGEDFAPMLGLLERRRDQPVKIQAYFEWIPLAASLRPFGLRQRLLQELVSIHHVTDQKRMAIGLDCIGNGLTQLRAYLDQHDSLQPAERELNTAHFIFILLDWLWIDSPLNALPVLAAQPDLARQRIQELTPFINLVRAVGASQNRLEILLSPDFVERIQGSRLYEEYIGNDKAGHLLNRLRRLRDILIPVGERI